MEADFSLKMLRRMGREISAAENHHHSFCKKNVRERVAEALILLQKKCGIEIPAGWRLEIQLSRPELANWIGTAKETVIRCLSEFKEEGLIQQDGLVIVLLDLPKLTRIAGLSKSAETPSSTLPQETIFEI